MTNVDSQVVDYTARDFTAIRAEMDRRMRRAIPAWEPNPASFESILMDQFAYHGDVINYYIDRMAGEAYIQTAVMRESVLNLAYAFGYVPTPQTAARGSVRFTKVSGLGNVFVPKGTQVYAVVDGVQVIYETMVDTLINTAFKDIDVIEGQTIEMEALGISSGGERQQFSLFRKNVIKDSIELYVQDGPIDASTSLPTFVRWNQIDRLIEADGNDRTFSIYVDDQGTTIINLGDNVQGRIPTVGAPIFATYRYGVGAAGNAAALAVTSLVSGDTLSSQIQTLSNADPMQGGADAESIRSMRINIPKSLRTLDRAVSLQDHADLALQVGGVAKTSASAQIHTNITVVVVPFGGGQPNAQLTGVVQTYLSTRILPDTTVTIIGPTNVPISVSITVYVNPSHRAQTVKDAVVAAVQAAYTFDNVELGGTSKLADIFAAATKVPGVDVVDITAHNRTGTGFNTNLTLAYNELPVAGTIAVTTVGGIIPA